MNLRTRFMKRINGNYFNKNKDIMLIKKLMIKILK